MSLSDLVNISIVTSGAQLQAPGFGMPLFATMKQAWADIVKEYTDPDDMLDDGFVATDAAYLAALKICGQIPRVPRFAIGRRALRPTLTVDFTPTAVNLTVYTIVVAGRSASFTSDASATVAEIVTGLKAALDTALAVAPAITNLVTTDATTKLTVAGNAAGVWFSYANAHEALVSVKETQADAGIATDLAAMKVDNGNWYGVDMDTGSPAEIVAAAAWIEANGRIMVKGTSETRIVQVAASTDVGGGSDSSAARLQAAGYTRSVTVYQRDNSMFSGAAAMGKCLPFDPGTETWAYKTLAGVDALPLTATQQTNARAKNCNMHLLIGNAGRLFYGVAASGEFIDNVRGIDALTADMQVSVYNVLASNPKVPFTDSGITLVECAIRSSLGRFTSTALAALLASFTVTVPLAADVSTADKEARILNGVAFSGILQGAVHVVDINGFVSVGGS